MKRLLLPLLLLLPLAAAALTPEEQQQFADGLYSRGMHDLAVQEYRRILTEHPAYAQADIVLYHLAESLRKSGKSDEAAAAYQKISEAHPGSAQVHKARLRLVELRSAAGDHAGALSLVGRLLSDKPGGEVEAATLYYQGLALQKTGRGDAARLAYQQLVDRFPDAPHAGYARLELAKLLQGGGSAEGARALLRQTADHPPSPRAGIEALSALADLEYAAQRYAEAASAFTDLRKRHPDHAPANELWIQAAWANFHAQRYPETLTVLGEMPAPARQAFAADALYLEANALRQTRREDEALARYAQLARDFPQSAYAPYASYETALVAYQRKQFAEVIAQAQQMMREPKLALDASWLHARALEQTGKPVEAIAQFERIASEHADSPRAPEALFEAARLRQERSDWAGAAEVFLRLADRFPKHELAGKALYAASVCAVKQDRLEPAIDAWSRLLRDHPGHELAAESLFQKGLAEMKLERRADAEATFVALLAHPKAEPRQIGESGYWLALLLEQQKKFPEAEKHLRDAAARLAGHALLPKVQYRLALVLQKQEKMQESADLVQSVLESPVASDIDPALLEWLVRRRLDEKAWDKAVAAADLMARNARDVRWKQLAFTLAGEALVAAGRPGDAVEPYTQALGIDVDSRERAEAALFLGRHQLGRKAFPEAAAHFERASALASRLSLLPLQARGYLGLGETAEARGDAEAASRYFMSVAVLFDDPALSPEALFRAAAAFKAQQRAADADKTMAELKQRYPQSPWAAKTP